LDTIKIEVMKISVQNFIEFGGFDSEAARECPKKTWKLLTQYTLMLFVPVTIGLFTAGYAAFILSDSLIGGIIGGLLYAAIIFVIDRGILSTGRSTKLSFGMLVRIAMAILLSTLAAEPLVLFVFEDAIVEEQYIQLQSQIGFLDEKYEERYEKLDSRLNKSADKLEDLRMAYTKEMDGTGGSGNKNKGPIYKQKYQDFLDYKPEHSKVVSSVEAEKKRLQDVYTTELKALNNAQAHSLSGRLDKLHDIDSVSIQVGIWILRLALIMLELAPIMIKLKKSDSWEVYWDIIDAQNNEKRLVHKQNSGHRVEVLDLEQRLYYEREAKELEFNHEKLVKNQLKETLKGKMDFAISLSQIKTDYLKKVMVDYVENEQERNDLINQLEIISADFNREFNS